MARTYNWTERIVKKDAAGAVLTDETYEHKVSWEDADIAVYVAGKASEATAVRDALAAADIPTQKTLIDYDTTSKKSAGITLNADFMDKAKAMNLALFPEWFLRADASADAHLTADSQAKATAFATAFAPLLASGGSVAAPRYISGPGQYAVDSNGSMLSLDAVNRVYRDGRPMKTSAGASLAAGLVAVVGKTIYARGLTVPSWWAWSGTTWVGPITDGDSAILTPATP